jgi:hypothetical protein
MGLFVFTADGQDASFAFAQELVPPDPGGNHLGPTPPAPALTGSRGAGAGALLKKTGAVTLPTLISVRDKESFRLGQKSPRQGGCDRKVTSCPRVCCHQQGQQDTGTGRVQPPSLSERYDLIPA